MTIQKVNTSRNTATRSTYVGEKGRLFYDEANGTLYISDGQTPGGSSIFNKLVNGNYSATLDSSGNLTVPGNLTVQGTTTTVVNETITNNETLTGTLTVSGFSTLANATLTGSGQNLFLYSNVINSTNWGTFNCTLTAGQTDPFGGTAATLINDGVAATTLHCPYQGGFILSGNVTFSVYAKAGTLGYLALYTQCGTGLAFFNLTNGTYLGGNAPTTSITSAGNGWYRCSMTFTGNGSSGGMYIMTANGTSTTNYNYTGNNGTLYIAFPQVSISSGPITYLGTTTSAITGNPQLSFNGNASLQMDSSGNLLVAPGGSGNVTINGGLLANPANKNVSIAPTGTGTATINPATAGAMNNMVIGGTTPAAGTFTTATVAGSLQNLFLQSQTFNTSPWGNTALTINQTATTAPDSTSTGNSLIPTAVSSIHRVAQGVSITAGVTYTASVYAKANGYNYLYFNCGAGFNGSTTFNISTGTVTNIGSGTATITSAGNGWYRCTITGTATATFTASLFIQVNSTQTLATDDTFTGDGTSGIYLWGAQLETSSTVHAYQVTTTAASSSSPKISLSGGGSIGLQSDGSLYVSPAGTGALQAQATTSTATGGNARGANAVDWQTSRNNAAYVASGSTSVIGGGYSNMAQGQYSAVGGGAYNSTSGYNTTIAGGQANQANQRYASIMGGYGNNALGYFNFIGNGYANSGTANAAVTSSTATIAVSAGTTFYLTATNANIKVGQLVNGTGITTFPDTYATSSVTTGTAAVMNTSTISGTTLTVGSLASGTIIAGQVLTGTGVTAGTYIVSGSGSSWTVSTSQTVTSTTITGTAYTFTISQNATTAAGVTLSFYTPHGVVVGGGNNQATGAYSFIGGGGDAGVAANRNVASGDWSFVGGGQQNQATGIASVVVGGGFNSVAYGNSASGISSVVGGGVGNNASGAYSVVCGGYNNTSDSSYSTSFGYRALTRAINNNFVISTRNSYGTFGTSQTGILVISKQTTDATSTVLTSDNNTASTTNQVILPNNSAYTFKGTMIANVTGGGNTSSWEFRGCIKRGAGVGTTALVGTPRIDNIGYDAGASTWAFTLTADTTNGGLAVTVTGQASTTIRWVAKIETTEVTY